jgi:hypothetical protein
VKRKAREVNVFSMSFLDAITAGFGAVVLLFMLVSQNALLDSRTEVDDMSAEAQRWELKVLAGQKNLVTLQEQLQQQLQEWTALRAMRQNLVGDIQQTQTQLESLATDSAARRAAIERLRSELATLDKESKDMAARPEDRASLRGFMGEGNRQYLTGLKMGGKRIVILVDTSTSMLDRTIVNILRRRNMTPEQQSQSPKWRQVVNTVDWLTAQIQPGTDVQIIGFSNEAHSLIPGSDGRWVSVSSASQLDAAVDGLRASYPKGPTSLHAAFAALRAMEPKPDNVYLLVDGLPTMGEIVPTRPGVTSRERLDHFNRAVRQLPNDLPINVILFAMEGDPDAAPAFWVLALRTGGSMLAPSEDWP